MAIPQEEEKKELTEGIVTTNGERCQEEDGGFQVTMSAARESNLWLMDPEAYSKVEETLKQLKNNTSWFSTPEGTAAICTHPEGREYTSHATLMADRRKQVRSTLEPQQKFDNPCLSSHSVGWGMEDAPVKNPSFGIRESPTTKYYHNMECTKSYHVLRFSR
eukprot:GHVS01067758.1.p1 GENE.GHVS01067758.1~~GHVS01067758.1.p1  ORF type:complete len:172 (-),score=29.05 GHVS01067758.1:204-689(-)